MRDWSKYKTFIEDDKCGRVPPIFVLSIVRYLHATEAKEQVIQHNQGERWIKYSVSIKIKRLRILQFRMASKL